MSPALDALGLPDGWQEGVGPHMGAMVVVLQPPSVLTHQMGATEWRLLADQLYMGGMDVAALYATALVKKPGDDAPTVEESIPYLAEEIQRTVPRYILALGQEVYTALTGLQSELALYRGIWQRLADRYDWDEALVIGTWTPAEALENPARMSPFRRDVREFARVWKSKFPDGAPPPLVQRTFGEGS